jgi:hypothetical protein
VTRTLLLACLVSAGVAASAAAPERAWACSCAGESPAALLARADGAFVGTFLDSRPLGPRGPLRSSADPAVYRFRVARALKGTLPPVIEVVSAESGASCGLEVVEGREIGLTVNRDGGTWRSSLCQQAEPAALAAVAPGGRIAASREEVARGFGRGTALAACTLLAVAAALLLIRRRYRPD